MGSGSLFRNWLKKREVVHKRCNTNPKKYFVHYKSPSRMFWKALRTMLPHKRARGAAALNRLKVFEGIPFPYDHKKRVVVPQALKCLRLKSHRKFCKLGDLAEKMGWTNGNGDDHHEDHEDLHDEDHPCSIIDYGMDDAMNMDDAVRNTCHTAVDACIMMQAGDTTIICLRDVCTAIDAALMMSETHETENEEHVCEMFIDVAQAYFGH